MGVAENTYVASTYFNMEWEDCLQPSASSFTVPPSFFDPKIDESNAFAGHYFGDLYNSLNYTTSSSINGSELGLDDDLSDVICNDFNGDNLLAGRDALSVLSDDELFSQIDASCSSLQDNSDNNCNKIDQYSDENDNEIVYFPKLEKFNHGNVDDKVMADCYDRFRGPATVPPPNDDSLGRLCGQRLEQMELDIAKLKQEVDSNSEEDSMLADFFSEDDASEISPEYEKFLKSLLITPADDFDMNLNVFDRLDENGEDSSDEDSDLHNRLVQIVMADHSYSQPWSESACSPPPGLPTPRCSPVPGSSPALVTMTPPNSGEDSDSESDSVYSSPITDNSELSNKFLTSKTVKLKHKKDLKFVFSFKVKDEDKVRLNGLVDNVNTPPASPPRSNLFRKSIYKGVSVLKKNQQMNSSLLSSYHYPKFFSSSRHHLAGGANTLAFKRAYKKRCQLQKHQDKTNSKEADLAVASILLPDTVGYQYQETFSPSSSREQSDRELHNSMERQRRVQLKQELDTLKDRIPDLRGNDKVSKLNVLNVAAGYVKKLDKVEAKLRQRKYLIREENKRLQQQLAKLKKHHISIHI